MRWTGGTRRSPDAVAGREDTDNLQNRVSAARAATQPLSGTLVTVGYGL